MDLKNTGKLLAELRKEKGYTQEQLGEKIGVTNKTISRWETGIYLPPADALLALGELYNVSINEILSGKRLTETEYKEAAEENLTQTIKASSFSSKAIKEHIAIMVFIGICIIAVLIAGIMVKNIILVSILPMLILIAHIWRNNTMMAYVERNAYDGTGN